MARLIDLCNIQYGCAFDSKYFTEDDSFPQLVRIRDVKRGFSETFYSGDYSEEYVLSSGDLLIGMDGEFNISRWKIDGALLNQRVCKVTAKDSIDEEYLRFALSVALKQIEEKTAFVTVKHLSAKELNKLEIGIPAYDKQREISETLKKLEKIVSIHRNELNMMDDLIKARFVELFGDPIMNPKGWVVKSIGELVNDVRYGTSNPAVEGGRYPYLRMNNLTYDGHIDLSDLKFIDVSDNELEKCVVRKGDVLFNRTNSVDLVGKTAVFEFEEDMVIAGYIIRVRLNNELLPEVLSQYMNLEAIKDILRNMAKGAVNQANINAQELQSIKVYVPDPDMQKQFVEIKKQVDKSKSVIQKSLDDTQLIFDSLMQQYFG